MPILPSQFQSTTVDTLLVQAAQGLIGFDCRLIDNLLARREETLDALERFVAAPRGEDLLDFTEQVFDLYRALESPRALPFFISLLEGREPGEIPDEMIEAISFHGAAAIEPLLELKSRLEAADGGDGEQGADVVFVLAALGARDPRISALFRDTLARDPYEGALCIGLAGDRSLKPDVQAALKALPESAVEERKVLAECIETLDRETVPDPREPFNIRPLYADEAMPLFDQIKPAEALEFLAVEDPEYRARAAASFLDEDYPDEIRDRLLALAQSETSPLVRGAACRSLGERVEEPEVRAYLLGRLREASEEDELEGLLVGLAGASQLPEVHAAVVSAWSKPALRAAAVETMWRSLDPRFAKYFEEALRSDDPKVKLHALQGIGAFGISSLALELVPLFDDDGLSRRRSLCVCSGPPRQDHQEIRRAPVRRN